MNIYVDCGTHLGEGIKKHIHDFGIDENWKIFTFEANTFTFDLLQSIRKNKILPSRYQWLHWNNIQFENRAVWVEDKEIDFYCSQTTVSLEELQNNSETSDFMRIHDKMVTDGDLVMPHQGNNLPIDGSSTLIPDKVSTFLLKNGNFFQRNLDWKNKIKVNSFDFSTWLSENVKMEDYVVCKIDIEGAEYEVLKKCISDDTLKLINNLDIEFHHIDDVEMTNDYNKIMHEIHKLNISYRTW